ncbi:MAG: NAD(P)H-dependent oxidoreductase subunit E [Syntrophomonadaceae bacterium]|nr:NAD(P)H-dependent oxidoreductase subunit E [Syntrophomonadaceae bacterium]
MEATSHVCKCREELDALLEQKVAQHAGKKDDLIEVLYWVQENYGYVPIEAQLKIAEALEVPLTTISGIITFYHFFSLKPKGKYEIALCKGTACYVRGATSVLDRFEKELGIKPHDTTDDNLISLEVVRCLGACGLAPVITVNKEPRPRMKADMVPGIIQEIRKKG